MFKRWCSIKEIEVFLQSKILISKDTVQGQETGARPSDLAEALTTTPPCRHPFSQLFYQIVVAPCIGGRLNGFHCIIMYLYPIVSSTR